MNIEFINNRKFIQRKEGKRIMLNVGIIGIGNAGNQVAALAKEELEIPVIAINSTERDLETISKDIPKKLIVDKEGKIKQGSGKDRKLAKQYLKDSVINLISSDDIRDMMDMVDEVFVISSTGGGTGSGTAPIMASILTEAFPETHVILVGITPVDGDAYSSHVNSLEYLQELYNVMSKPTYMLYDNDRLSGMPTYKILEAVNREIVKDIDVLRGRYNYTTKYDSIDDKDLTRLLSFPGRVVVARLENFKEKDCDTVTIEDLIINKLKTNCHVESQRDKRIIGGGLITNLSPNLNEDFDNNIPNVKEFIGEPLHNFNHIYVTEDRAEDNNVFLIMTGLSPINDKLEKISDRVTEIDEKRKTMEEDLLLNSVDMGALSDKITDEKRDTKSEVDIADMFNRFGI